MISECTGPEDFILEDGSVISVDALVQCTGYAYDFPFLRGCGLEWTTSNVGPLYKHIVNINYPRSKIIRTSKVRYFTTIQETQNPYTHDKNQ